MEVRSAVPPCHRYMLPAICPELPPSLSLIQCSRSEVSAAPARSQ